MGMIVGYYSITFDFRAPYTVVPAIFICLLQWYDLFIERQLFSTISMVCKAQQHGIQGICETTHKLQEASTRQNSREKMTEVDGVFNMNSVGLRSKACFATKLRTPTTGFHLAGLFEAFAYSLHLATQNLQCIRTVFVVQNTSIQNLIALNCD